MPSGKLNHFIDTFGGGFNVGVNINASGIIYNDINHFVRDLIYPRLELLGGYASIYFIP